MTAKRIHDLCLAGILAFAAFWLVLKPLWKVLFG